MSEPVWVVKDVSPQKDYTLLITFSGGKLRQYNARPLLQKPIFAPLKDLNFFLRAKAVCGSVAWNDEIDIAPEHLYEHSIPVQLQ